MPWRQQAEASKTERIVGGLSYLTFGIAGLLYVIFNKTGDQSQQFKFHFYQAVLISILGMLVSYAATPLLEIVLSLVSLASPQVAGQMAGVVGIVALVLKNAFFLLLLYGTVMAFLGKFAEIPFISNLVRNNMRA